VGRQNSGGSAARKIHGSYIVTATCLIQFLPPTSALLIRTELIGSRGHSAVVKAVNPFGRESLSQQWVGSSVDELTGMAQRDSQGAELASKVHTVCVITFPIVIIF